MFDWYQFDGPMSGGWIAMSIMMGLFWALIVLGAVASFRMLGSPTKDSRPDPQQILDERLARGELDEAGH